MIRNWKFFAKTLAFPAFFFLCLDFLYRLSEMNVARDAWLSFAFLEGPSMVAVLATALTLAVLSRISGERAGGALKGLAAAASFWMTAFLFLFYLKKWVLSFTLADEEGTLVLRGKHVLIFSAVLTGLGVFLWNKSGRFQGLRSGVSSAANRLSVIIAAVTVVSLLSLGSVFLRAPGEAQAVERTPAEGRRPNVLLIVTDTLGALNLSAYGGSEPTPSFDRWSREGLFFKNARTDVTCTGPSISSILTGKTPRKSRVLNYHSVPGPASRENLLTYLTSFGYETATLVDLDYASALFHGFPTPNGGETLAYLAPRVNAVNQWLAERARRLGFTLRFRLPQARSVALKPFATAFDELADRLKRKGSGERPWFGYVHVYLPSRIVPKDGPAITLDAYPRFYRLEEQREIDAARKDYARTVAEWDAALGLLLDRLKSEGLLDDTIVALTADHGESFSHGFWGHGDDLSEDSIRIPMLFLAPHREGRTFEAPILNSDIAPTLLELLKLPKPEWMDGVSGLSGDAGREAVTYNTLTHTSVRAPIAFPGLLAGRSIALYENGLKLIKRPSGPSELYDLAADPSESKDIAATDAERTAAMERRLSDYLSGTK